MKTIAYFCFLFIVCIQFSMAGVAMNGTRIIYHEGAREYGLRIANTNTYPILFQPWVDHGDGEPNSNLGPFVIVPPFIKMEESDVSTLRMVYDGSKLPEDRESVFWLNLYEVPLMKKKKENTQYLNMAMNTQVKVFYRPKNLKAMDIDEIVGQVKFRLIQNEKGYSVLIDNPTPYSLSLLNIILNDQKETILAKSQPTIDTLVLPFSQKQEYLDSQVSNFNDIAYAQIHVIDDFGKTLKFKKEISK